MSRSPKRLPVYVLLDTSGSMSGDPIEAARQGLRMLMTELRQDPMARETAWVSVITFNSTAQQVYPLTEVTAFPEDSIDQVLTANGTTAMGEAMDVLLKAADAELMPNYDYKPLVFLITDGQPTDTDRWSRMAKQVRDRQWSVIACAAGTHIEAQALTVLTPSVVFLHNCQPGALKSFFKWMSLPTKAAPIIIAEGRGIPPSEWKPPAPPSKIHSPG